MSTGNDMPAENLLKSAVSWILVGIGSLTAAKIATYFAIAYTGAQLYVLIRDKIFRRKS